MCFDVAHAYAEGGNDAIDDFLGSYADLVSHLRVHDARSCGDGHLPVGAGAVDLDLVVDRLTTAGFDGTVAVEAFADDLALCVDSLRRTRAAFERSGWRSDSAVRPQTRPVE